MLQEISYMPDARLLMKRLPALLAAGVLLMPLAHGQEGQAWQDDDHSYDKARRAVERGDALPVTEVMRHLRHKVHGDIVATEYEFEFHRWVYEFKVLDAQGRLKKVHIDAATGEMIDEKHD